jgi:folate-dependent phosphoribosylglycinamide formyltransferase PurN
MIVGIFGYDFPHFKTNEIVKNTFFNNFSIGALFLAPKKNYSDNGSVTSTDKSSKNKDIRRFCKENNIPVFRVEHDNTSRIEKIVSNNNIDIAIIGGARIINQSVIDKFALGVVNYHPGRIPETSGLDSLYRAIEYHIPPCVTVHLIDDRVDAGLFILESVTEVFFDDTLNAIENRILLKQIELNSIVLNGIERKTFCFPEIIRPKKNERLSAQEKTKIMHNFNNWKKAFSKK